MSSKYKIIFDSNILWQNNENYAHEFFSLASKESINFFQEHQLNKKVILAIPEIVIMERTEHQLKLVNSNLEKIKNGLSVLKNFDVDISKKYYSKDYKTKIKKNITKSLNKLGIERLIIPHFNQKNLIKRSVEKIRPFSGNGDKGFKDTLIWLSILDDAQKNKELSYIICTTNEKDFDSTILRPEFEKINKNEFHILKDFPTLKEFLDKELNLDLKLKETYKQIEEKILKKTGSLMVLLNSLEFEARDTKYDFLPQLNAEVMTKKYYPSFSQDNDIVGKVVGYDFIKIEILDINLVSENNYNVQANLTVKPCYKEEISNANSIVMYDIYNSYNLRPTKKIFYIDLTYNAGSDTININSSLGKSENTIF